MLSGLLRRPQKGRNFPLRYLVEAVLSNTYWLRDRVLFRLYGDDTYTSNRCERFRTYSGHWCPFASSHALPRLLHM